VSAPRYDVPREEIDALAAEARKAGLAPAADMLVWLWQMLGSSRTYAAALVKVQPRKVREATEAAVHADCEALYEADFAEAARWLAEQAGYVLEADRPEEAEDDGSCSACHGSGGGDYPMACGYCSGRGYAKRQAHAEEPGW
jgi:mono/diheme cytochrome c family protein